MSHEDISSFATSALQPRLETREGDGLSAGISLLEGQELDLERGGGDMETVVATGGST